MKRIYCCIVVMWVAAYHLMAQTKLPTSGNPVIKGWYGDIGKTFHLCR